MKSLLTTINEKLVINKHSKVKSKLEFNLEEFQKFIKDKLNYTLTDDDFKIFKNNYLETNQLLNKCKFIDITDDTFEWNHYLGKIAKHVYGDNYLYIIQKLNKGILFHYNQIEVDHVKDNGYRIGYILDNAYDNMNNKDKVKIFKVKA